MSFDQLTTSKSSGFFNEIAFGCVEDLEKPCGFDLQVKADVC